MDNDKSKAYVDAIINLQIPRQSSYTYEEVYVIVNTLASWVASQVEDELEGDRQWDDLADFIRNAFVNNQ